MGNAKIFRKLGRKIAKFSEIAEIAKIAKNAENAKILKYFLINRLFLRKGLGGIQQQGRGGRRIC